jgi:hypothetical protein
MTRGAEAAALVLPDRKLLVDRVPRTGALPAAGGGARWIDLATGEITPLPWRGSADALEIPGGRACTTPALIVFGP